MTATTPGSVRYADANGLTLAYETFGSPSDPPILLVMGLATQMLGWPEEICESLAASGFYVIRYDNRDIGLSTHLDGAPTPTIAAVALHRQRPPYTIDDLAADAVGLLDALGIRAAHVVGASMGGFISQTIAVRYPPRVLSLTLVMTTTGARHVGLPKLAVAGRLARAGVATDRAAALDASIATSRLIGSVGYPFDATAARDLAARSYDRAYDPSGVARQLAACIAQPNRTKALRRVTVPTVVIHGLADPLVGPSGGLAVARAIPGAHFVGLSGMGHDLPRPLWPRVISEIRDVTARATAPAPQP
jgi:pimeloyl-ACP methyl ester carboxylesterase